MYLECGPGRIRSWRNGDEEKLPVHANNRKIWLNLRDQFPHPYTPADAKRWVRHTTRVTPETSFAIEVGGEAVGGIALVLGLTLSAAPPKSDTGLANSSGEGASQQPRS